MYIIRRCPGPQKGLFLKEVEESQYSGKKNLQSILYLQVILLAKIDSNSKN